MIVVDRDKGWFKGGDGAAAAMPKDQRAAFLQGLAGLRLAESLLPLCGKEWKLSSLGEMKIDDTKLSTGSVAADAEAAMEEDMISANPVAVMMPMIPP